MRGHRLTTIALSLILVGACGQRRTVTLDGSIDVAPLTPDKGTQPDSVSGPDQDVLASAWAVGGSLLDRGWAIATDTAGNSFVTGVFKGAATFGPTTLTSKAQAGDMFVAKLDSTGKWTWACSAQGPGGSAGGPAGMGISVDGAGNIYVAGHFEGSVSFGSTSLTSSGTGLNAFVAKLDSTGQWIWARSVSGELVVGRGIRVDDVGNSHITGHFRSSATFGSTSMTAKGHCDMFVAKLDSKGTWLWQRSTGGGGASSTHGMSISIDSAGNSYVTGGFWGEVSIGAATLKSKSTKSHEDDVFVAKLDRMGKWQWATSGGGDDEDRGKGISVDSAGNCYVAGYLGGSASFGSTKLTNIGWPEDVFVAKLDGAGKWLWARSTGGPGKILGMDVSTDSAGNSHVTGMFQGDARFGSTMLTTKNSALAGIYVVKLSSDGAWLWARSATDLKHPAAGNAISVDGAGNSHVTGFFAGTVGFGSTSLTAKGEDVFVWRIGKDGM